MLAVCLPTGRPTKSRRELATTRVILEHGPDVGSLEDSRALRTELAHLRRPCHAFQVQKLLSAGGMVPPQA